MLKIGAEPLEIQKELSVSNFSKVIDKIVALRNLYTKKLHVCSPSFLLPNKQFDNNDSGELPQTKRRKMDENSERDTKGNKCFSSSLVYMLKYSSMNGCHHVTLKVGSAIL